CASIFTCVVLVAAVGYWVPALGGVDALGTAAVDLEQPRIRNLQRVARLVTAYGLAITAALAFLVVALIPSEELRAWTAAPLAGLALRIGGPLGLRFAVLFAVVLAAVAFLFATVRAAASGAHSVIARCVDDGILPEGWRALHHRFGTPWRIIDATAVVQLAIVFVTAGETAWLARAYAFGVA